MACGETQTSRVLKLPSVVCRGNRPTRAPSCRTGPGEEWALGASAGPTEVTLIRKCLCLLGLEQGHQAVCSLLHSFAFNSFNTKTVPSPTGNVGKPAGQKQLPADQPLQVLSPRRPRGHSTPTPLPMLGGRLDGSAALGVNCHSLRTRAWDPRDKWSLRHWAEPVCLAPAGLDWTEEAVES